MKHHYRYFVAFSLLAAAAIFKLWILPLRSSFWVDEMVTAFVVHYGRSHPSLTAAPQLLATVYYWLPWAAERLWGFSEVAYRIPSTLAMVLAMFLLARLAMRLIHPGAGWFVVFAALTLRGINYEAADARPYALATCVALGAAWFLVRWLDTARWLDALGYIVCAALLWRVHLILWPFYLVLGAYTLLRALRAETPVSWWSVGVVYALLGAALVPVLVTTLKLLAETKAHVIFTQPPTWKEFGGSYKFVLVAGAGAGAWLLGLCLKWPRQKSASGTALLLILGWWVCQPLALFTFSLLTGNNVFVTRYLWLSLPGAALAATAAAAYFIPSDAWRPAALILGSGVVLLMGGVPHLSPLHHGSNWREAAREIRSLGIQPNTPVVYPSPFIEAKFPVWKPDYALPGFLYCHLLTYPVGGTPYLLPFTTTSEAEQYASAMAAGVLASSHRFVLYGGDINVEWWRRFFAQRPALADWRSHKLGSFGDVEVVVFEEPHSASGLPCVGCDTALQRGPVTHPDTRSLAAAGAR
ncbi:MAG: glycosyltransferase family 39 protein [Acidobacteriota bacterium]|nr:glycosyltransferase family 39 protein [Acidobacteriota bacterium]